MDAENNTETDAGDVVRRISEDGSEDLLVLDVRDEDDGEIAVIRVAGGTDAPAAEFFWERECGLRFECDRRRYVANGTNRRRFNPETLAETP